MASLKDDPEVAVDLDKLMTSLTGAVTAAAAKLRSDMKTKPDWTDSPVLYHIPRFVVSVQLSLSSHSNKISGIFRKTQSGEGKEILSKIELEIVAVPNPALKA